MTPVRPALAFAVALGAAPCFAARCAGFSDVADILNANGTSSPFDVAAVH